jgi:putative phosphoribosyl transferase
MVRMSAWRQMFEDRRSAGRQLGRTLQGLRASNPLVLALPRGGVPVAFEVAKAFGADLDVLLVRKIGAPGNEELGLGAVVDGHDPQIVWNDEALQRLKPSNRYLSAEVRRQLQEIERRRKLYFGGRRPPSVADRTVILVDDGIATGGTVRSALRALRRSRARRVILAVPVAPAQAIAALNPEADEVVCLATPEPFHAVGQHYGDFAQTTDEEVIALLTKSRAAARVGSADNDNAAVSSS